MRLAFGAVLNFFPMKSHAQELSTGPLSTGAVGDAYGFVFEFADTEFISEFNDLSFHRRPYSNLPLGVYSDDTQMHMAIAEVIASERDWTALEIASSFVNVFHRDPHQGYAGGFYEFLQRTKNGADFLKNIIPRSERNGAAMRAPIIGLYPDLNEVMTRSEIQAKITHDTKVGVDSAIASSLLCHFFAFELGAKDEVGAFLEKHVPGHNWEKPWKGMVDIHGIATVRAALTAIKKTDSLAELLKECVNFTGDVDSVATIALASASMAYTIKKDIPERLWSGLENNKFGLNYLMQLEKRVIAVTHKIKKER